MQVFAKLSLIFSGSEYDEEGNWCVFTEGQG
jgi:hypothetical protein